MAGAWAGGGGKRGGVFVLIAFAATGSFRGRAHKPSRVLHLDN
jgi:hypothetical protein